MNNPRGFSLYSHIPQGRLLYADILSIFVVIAMGYLYVRRNTYTRVPVRNQASRGLPRCRI